MANNFICAACGEKIRKPGIIISGDDYYCCPNCKRVIHAKCTVQTGWVFKDNNCPLCGFKFPD